MASSGPLGPLGSQSIQRIKVPELLLEPNFPVNLFAAPAKFMVCVVLRQCMY